MVSSASLKLVIVAIFLGLLVCLPTGSEGRSCVFGCMSEVISCKRKAALGAGTAGECCDRYYQCFADCKTGKTDLPRTSIQDTADKRPVRLSGALLLERLNKKMAYRPAKTTRMLFAIFIVFVLSFLPFFCIVITRAVRGKAFLASLTDAGVVLISIFIRSSFLSNAANPIIYGVCNKQFRTECRRLARRVSGKEHDVTLRVIEQTDDALGSENS